MGEIQVLVVDEDREVLDLTATFLEQQDTAIEVVTETTGADAVETFETEAIDAVVSDLRMPEMDGVELAERIAAGDDVPFFLFTGADEHRTGERTADTGVAAVIQKGTGTDHYERLASRIRAAVEG